MDGSREHFVLQVKYWTISVLGSIKKAKEHRNPSKNLDPTFIKHYFFSLSFQ